MMMVFACMRCCALQVLAWTARPAPEGALRMMGDLTVMKTLPARRARMQRSMRGPGRRCSSSGWAGRGPGLPGCPGSRRPSSRAAPRQVSRWFSEHPDFHDNARALEPISRHPAHVLSMWSWASPLCMSRLHVGVTCLWFKLVTRPQVLTAMHVLRAQCRHMPICQRLLSIALSA